jgi:hypothetical protein
MAFTKAVSTHIDLCLRVLCFKQKTYKSNILNEVARLIDLGDKTTLAENFGTINAENLRKAHAF